MSRADIVRNIVVLEQFAAEARRLRDEYRAQLVADASAELTEQGSAPTWRMPEVATVSLAVTKQSIVVADSDILQAWVAHRHPSEIDTQITTRVRPAFLTALLGSLKAEDGIVIDPETGEIVPGLSVLEGGKAGPLSIRPDKALKATVAAAVGEMLGTARAALVPVPAEALEGVIGQDVWSAEGDPFALFPAAGEQS